MLNASCARIIARVPSAPFKEIRVVGDVERVLITDHHLTAPSLGSGVWYSGFRASGVQPCDHPSEGTVIISGWVSQV